MSSCFNNMLVEPKSHLIEKISNIRGKKEIYSGRYFVVKGSLRARKLVKKDETKPKESTAVLPQQFIIHKMLSTFH